MSEVGRGMEATTTASSDTSDLRLLSDPMAMLRHGLSGSRLLPKILSIIAGCLMGLFLAFQIIPKRSCINLAVQWQPTCSPEVSVAMEEEGVHWLPGPEGSLFDDIPSLSGTRHGDNLPESGASDSDSGQSQRDSGPKPPVKVLLLTYFRGGSTFLGDVFNQNPNAFYMFEPLAAPVFTYKARHHVKDYSLNDRQKVISRPRSLVNTLLQVVHTILNCDIPHLDRSVLQHYFAVKWSKSKQLFDYQRCVRSVSRLHGGNVSEEVVAACEDYVTARCAHSGVRAIKVIRLMMHEVELLLRRDPDIKVIFYVRDPRGTLLSRWNVGVGEYTPAKVGLRRVDESASYLCAKMRSDIRAYDALRKRNPDSVFLARYEDLAEDSLEQLRKIYKFVGADLPPGVVTWIEGATHAKRNDGQVGSRRLNSTIIAERWREVLPVYVQQRIVDKCVYVLRKLGYSTKVT